MTRVRGRIADKRVLGLVRAFLQAGVLTEDGLNRDTRTGTPHGAGSSHHSWPASPCPCWMSTSPPGGKCSALSWTRAKHRRAGAATMKLLRYADTVVVLVRGPRVEAEALFGEVADAVAPDRLAPIGAEDSPDPHRGRVQRPRLAHPAPEVARTRPDHADCLHLPIEDVPCVDHSEDPELTHRRTHRTLADPPVGSTRRSGSGAGTSPARGI